MRLTWLVNEENKLFLNKRNLKDNLPTQSCTFSAPSASTPFSAHRPITLLSFVHFSIGLLPYRPLLHRIDTCQKKQCHQQISFQILVKEVGPSPVTLEDHDRLTLKMRHITASSNGHYGHLLWNRRWWGMPAGSFWAGGDIPFAMTSSLVVPPRISSGPSTG